MVLIMFAEFPAVALASAWAQSTPAPAQSPVVAGPVTAPGLATMSFDPSGKRTSCVEVDSVGTLKSRTDPCADPTFDQLPPAMLQARMAAETVRFLWALYLKNDPK